MTRLIAAIALLCLFATVAEARPKQARHDSAELSYCVKDGTYRQTCGTHQTRTTRLARITGEGVIGRRPAGCPTRYCGCEASLYKFGRIIPELNLAYNWIRKFPRTSPGPGMAAARRGHVMILISHVEGQNWLTHDGNSGGGLTRRHVQSIKGFVIVNPDATRVASHD
jgi:hypothetical protein